MAIFVIFRHFRAFWAPWGLPGPRVPRGFYINPSRRGPAVPAGSPKGAEVGSAVQAPGARPE